MSTQLMVYSAFLSEPTSAPLDLFVEDKNDTSVTIIWSQPEVVGSSGLDGYTVEISKDGSKSYMQACQIDFPFGQHNPN